MAGCNLAVSSGEVTVSAATAKTVLQIVAAAQHRVRVAGISVYFKGTVVTDTPALVQICRQTTAGTMSAATPVKKDENMAETVQTTAQHTATAEPTATDILESIEVHPQTGLKMYFPLGQEIMVKGGNRLGIKVTSPQAQTVTANIEFEE